MATEQAAGGEAACDPIQPTHGAPATTLSASHSALKGITPDKGGMWRARINHASKRHYCGKYASQELAAQAYDQAAVLLHGPVHAVTNFGVQKALTSPLLLAPHIYQALLAAKAASSAAAGHAVTKKSTRASARMSAAGAACFPSVGSDSTVASLASQLAQQQWLGGEPMPAAACSMDMQLGSEAYVYTQHQLEGQVHTQLAAVGQQPAAAAVAGRAAQLEWQPEASGAHVRAPASAACISPFAAAGQQLGPPLAQHPPFLPAGSGKRKAMAECPSLPAASSQQQATKLRRGATAEGLQAACCQAACPAGRSGSLPAAAGTGGHLAAALRRMSSAGVPLLMASQLHLPSASSAMLPPMPPASAPATVAASRAADVAALQPLPCAPAALPADGAATILHSSTSVLQQSAELAKQNMDMLFALISKKNKAQGAAPAAGMANSASEQQPQQQQQQQQLASAVAPCCSGGASGSAGGCSPAGGSPESQSGLTAAGSAQLLRGGSCCGGSGRQLTRSGNSNSTQLLVRSGSGSVSGLSEAAAAEPESPPLDSPITAGQLDATLRHLLTSCPAKERVNDSTCCVGKPCLEFCIPQEGQPGACRKMRIMVELETTKQSACQRAEPGQPLLPKATGEPAPAAPGAPQPAACVAMPPHGQPALVQACGMSSQLQCGGEAAVLGGEQLAMSQLGSALNLSDLLLCDNDLHMFDDIGGLLTSELLGM